MENFLNPSLPTGNPIDAWRRVRSKMENLKISSKKNYKIIVVGTGLAGSAAAATLAEKGFNVKVLTFHESPRRASTFVTRKVTLGLGAILRGEMDVLEMGNIDP